MFLSQLMTYERVVTFRKAIFFPRPVSGSQEIEDFRRFRAFRVIRVGIHVPDGSLLIQ